ncbi:MAG: SNF2-related protein [Vampirovibrionales bacterium]
MTRFHSKYFAHDILRHNSENEVNKLSQALFNSCVDLNPHQIDAALFALNSPFSKGVILADEVGLGKTIEAGIVLCQLWAERKRCILVIAPASLQKQWANELEDKFNMPSVVLDSKTYRQALRSKFSNPFEQKNKIVICSYQFAVKMKDEIRAVPWDRVVIDEAHKLRNAHQESNKTGQALKWALDDAKKLLLTATPLQNSLLELYGLTSFIDESIFGDVTAFKAQYTPKTDLEGLRQRISPFLKRTLRKHVHEYINYTQRKPLTKSYQTSDDEQQFYEQVSQFLQREDTYALPKQQKHLIALNLRKMLGSSTVAMIGSLEKILNRLYHLRDLTQGCAPLALNFYDLFSEDEDHDPELIEMLDEETSPESSVAPTSTNELDKGKLQREIHDIEAFIHQARRIKEDSRSQSLLDALQQGFETLEALGAKRKALIFTESRRTQDYLKAFLEDHGYKGKIVLFNGSNHDAHAHDIYEHWKNDPRHHHQLTGSKAIEVRQALVDHFKDSAEVMIATEAGAEGINLQFCSMVVNYDMPWNPQRVEQRIGRCHRYGQTHDVVVLNFVNQRNQVERRVFELLQEKFHLFDGVFGSSDEVLGTIKSGIDFEKQVTHIFETCRTSEAIAEAFDLLQKDLEASIKSRMQQTQDILLQHFDEEVHAKLALRLDETKAQLDRISKLFWKVTEIILKNHAHFHQDTLTFELRHPPEDFFKGTYHLIRQKEKSEKAMPTNMLYRLSHPLGEWVLQQACDAILPVQEVRFDITHHPTKITVIQALKGQSGWLRLHKFRFETADIHEELLFTAITDDGRSLEAEVCCKLFECAGTLGHELSVPDHVKTRLEQEYHVLANATTQRIAEQHHQWFKEESTRIDRLEDDLIKPLELELEEVKQNIKKAKRKQHYVETLTEQQAFEEALSQLSQQKKRLENAKLLKEEAIEALIDKKRYQLKQCMKQKVAHEPLFTLRWFVQ